MVMRIGVSIVNAREFDNVLPGSKMAICAVPAIESRVAGIVAASCADWIRLGVICTVAPLGAVHWMTAPELKYWPLTVIEAALLPDTAAFGVTALIVSGEMVNGKLVDAAPLEFVTAICAVPLVVSNAAGIVAVIWPA